MAPSVVMDMTLEGKVAGVAVAQKSRRQTNSKFEEKESNYSKTIDGAAQCATLYERRRPHGI